MTTEMKVVHSKVVFKLFSSCFQVVFKLFSSCFQLFLSAFLPLPRCETMTAGVATQRRGPGKYRIFGNGQHIIHRGDAHNEYQSALVAEGLDRGMTAAQIADVPEVSLDLIQVETMTLVVLTGDHDIAINLLQIQSTADASFVGHRYRFLVRGRVNTNILAAPFDHDLARRVRCRCR